MDTPQTMPGDPELEGRLRRVREGEDARVKLRRRVRVERMVLLPILALAFLAWPNFGVAKVVGASMEPTFHTGDTLIVLKTFRWLSPVKPGDVVVIQMKHGEIKGEDIVKRVVFIQNAEGNAPWPAYLPGKHRDIPSNLLFPAQASGFSPVPRNGILVLGDNLPRSMDSREFGPITRYEIIGKVVYP